MSTWGTGLFASDGAQDFLEDLAELPPDDRTIELERLVREVLEDPSSLMRTVFPETVIAAAALVALSLPGGEQVMESQSSFVAEAVSEAALDRPAPQLAFDALRVIDVVTAPNGFWSQSWRTRGDREEALNTIAAVKEILSSVDSK